MRGMGRERRMIWRWKIDLKRRGFEEEEEWEEKKGMIDQKMEEYSIRYK